MREISPRAQEEEVPGAPRARPSARTHRGTYAATCADQDGFTRVVINALGMRRPPRGHTPRAPAGPAAAHDARTSTSSAPQTRAKARIEAPTPAAPVKAGLRGDDRQREVPLLGSYPLSRQRLRQAAVAGTVKPTPRERAPLFTARAPPTIHRLDLQPITARPSLEEGILTPPDDLRHGEFKLGRRCSYAKTPATAAGAAARIPVSSASSSTRSASGRTRAGPSQKWPGGSASAPDRDRIPRVGGRGPTASE